MKIRTAEAGDEAAVIALWDAADLLVNPLNDPVQDFQFCRDSGHGEILVGERDDRLIAAAMVGHDGHRGWMWYVATHPAERDQGLGRRMVHACEKWLHKAGVQKIELLVRDTNTRVIGFYQRLGYIVEPREVMSKRLDGKPVKAGGQSNDAPVVITYLEMTRRPPLPMVAPTPKKLALLQATNPTVAFYRFLYHAVGRDWIWTDRKKLSDDALAEIIKDERVDVFVLYVDGVPAGFFELDRRGMPDIDLAYFGIMPDFIGQRLGPYLLTKAVDIAWSREPERLTVNTCTLDHPKALPMYQRFGFQPIARKEVPSPWRRFDPVLEES